MATAYHRLARETPEYAWWKLPVAGFLAFVFFMMAVGALLLVALVVMYAVGLDGGDRIAEWFDAAALVDVDRPDFFALDMLGIAVMIPALLLAVFITGPRPIGYLTSVTGRMRWSWLGHTSVLATAVFGGGIAALVLPLLGGSRAGFLFLAGFVLAGAIGGALVLRTGVAEHVGVDEVDSSLHDRALWLLCGGSGFYLVAQIATMSFLVLFLVDARGWSTGSAAAVLAAGQVVAAGLRIGVGRWSDTMRARVRPLRLVGIAVAIALAFVATLADAPESVLVPLLVVTTGLSMAWNGLSFTIAAEIGGRRSGAAIGLQQTVLSAVGVVAPIAFAATVSWSSWRAAFGLAAVFPVVGWLLLGSLRDRDGRVGAGHAPLSRSSAAAPRPDRP